VGKTTTVLEFALFALIILIIIAVCGVAYHSAQNYKKTLAVAQSLNSNDCQEVYKKDTTVRIGKVSLDVELAKTATQKEKGLGGRDCIGGKDGMLFIFNRPDLYTFWMKDMRFPIDIIWIGPDKKVVKIESNVSPDTYPHSFTNDDPALYVLETKANLSTLLKIKNGAQLEF